MDIIVTENKSSSRQYRVNEVTDSAEAVARVQAITDKQTPEGITVLEQGQSDTVQHYTQVAPPRTA